MTDKYDLLFEEFKTYIDNNSQYGARVVKYNTNTSTYFPIVTFLLSNWTSSNEGTIDGIEYYDNLYFTIDIYTQDKVINDITIASNKINDDLVKLTINFFNRKNMFRTLCRPMMNVDTSILRTTIQYQCMVGNARNNIIRR